MKEQWQLVANKGCFALDVITPIRALCDKLLSNDDFEWTDTKLRFVRKGVAWHYLLRLKPDGDSDPVLMFTPGAASVREFIKNMEPHSVTYLVDETENEETVRARIEGRLQ